MRTKQTGKRSSANGHRSLTPKTSDANGVKSPPQAHQPPDLSDADRAGLKKWLDAKDKPFTVTAIPLSRKRKRDSQALQIQSDLWEDRLSVQYEIKPRNNWESLRRYKKFTVGSESIATGQCILVKHDSSEDARMDVAAQWKAKVLEVRALDSEHVYLRVAWLNRPEDLAGGRKAYHGRNELVPTNEMDIIDAMTVNGSLEVLHWDDDDDTTTVNSEQYFWRQTYDRAGGRGFSDLRKLCVDKSPQNPDQTILQCSNEECREWLHVKCIAETAVKQAANDTSVSSKGTANGTPNKKKGRPPKNAHLNSDSANAKYGTLTAKVYIKGLPEGPDQEAATDNEIVIVGPDGAKRAHDLSCLICHTTIEE